MFKKIKKFITDAINSQNQESTITPDIENQQSEPIKPKTKPKTVKKKTKPKQSKRDIVHHITITISPISLILLLLNNVISTSNLSSFAIEKERIPILHHLAFWPKLAKLYKASIIHKSFMNQKCNELERAVEKKYGADSDTYSYLSEFIAALTVDNLTSINIELVLNSDDLFRFLYAIRSYSSSSLEFKSLYSLMLLHLNSKYGKLYKNRKDLKEFLKDVEMCQKYIDSVKNAENEFHKITDDNSPNEQYANEYEPEEYNNEVNYMLDNGYNYELNNSIKYTEKEKSKLFDEIEKMMNEDKFDEPEEKPNPKITRKSRKVNKKNKTEEKKDEPNNEST